MRIQFLGANRQVTGSRYLLDVGDLRLMIDCGMFQERPFVGRNWETPIVDPTTVDYLILTHAHLDHVGLIPRYVANGFSKPIICTEPTADLADIIMMDSAKIQREDAKYKAKRHKKEGRKSPHPPVPLYTSEDAQKAAKLCRGERYNQEVRLNDSVTVTFHEAGHILGSAIVEVRVKENSKEKSIVFSGDLGQSDRPLINDPSVVERADYVIMESTYGDRDHRENGDVTSQLETIIKHTVQRGGNLVIPTFAVERAQELMYHVGKLAHDDKIPDLPVYLDSPMAVNVTEIFYKYRSYMDEHTQQLFRSSKPPLDFPGLRLVRSVDESKAINVTPTSKIIMASSGMCTGGRIKHHLRANISRPDSTVLFVGYQAHGTLGRLILEGRPEVRIHGRSYRVQAQVEQIFGFSAHGDRADLLNWIGNFDKHHTKRVFLTHGDFDAAQSLSKAIDGRFNLDVTIPEYMDSFDLS